MKNPVSKYAKSLLRMNFGTISVYLELKKNPAQLKPYDDTTLSTLGNWRIIQKNHRWVLASRVSHDVITQSINDYMQANQIQPKNYTISFTNSWPYGDIKEH